MRLKDKVAVVTGAGQGMGRAIARAFAAEGATVIAIDVNAAAAQESLGSASGLALNVDIADSAAVDGAFEQALAKFGRVDVLVNNAGVGSVDAFADIPDDDLGARHRREPQRRVLLRPRRGARDAGKGRRGTVINVSSTAAVSGDGPAHYCASKAALMGLTRSMAKELAASRHPRQHAGARADQHADDAGHPQGVGRRHHQGRADGPHGRARGHRPAWRCSWPATTAGFVTGQNLAVNGGSAFL
jgi:NAD(P)-dependent dehydrogenase (short-subunit alcohol dehydrogenase family)